MTTKFIPSKDTVEGLAWHHAALGKLAAIKTLFAEASSFMSKQFILDMTLMGSTDSKDFKETLQKACKEWAWINGGCILWTIQQAEPEFVRPSNDSNERLKRLHGNGEISKGFTKVLSN